MIKSLSYGVDRPLAYEGCVIHGLPWHVLVLLALGLLPTNQPRGVPDRRAPRRHVNQHNLSGPNLSPGANLHVTKNRGSCTDQHAVPNVRVPVADSLPSSTQGDVV
jgi:hypothetical protein